MPGREVFRTNKRFFFLLLFFKRTVLLVDSVYSLVTSTSFTALIDVKSMPAKIFLRLLTTDLYSGAAIDYRSFKFFDNVFTKAAVEVVP